MLGLSPAMADAQTLPRAEAAPVAVPAPMARPPLDPRICLASFTGTFGVDELDLCPDWQMLTPERASHFSTQRAWNSSSGYWKAVGFYNDKPVYQKESNFPERFDTPPDCFPLMYFSVQPGYEPGWWIGLELEATAVMGFAQAPKTCCFPPKHGWKLPWNEGVVHAGVRFECVDRAALRRKRKEEQDKAEQERLAKAEQEQQEKAE